MQANRTQYYVAGYTFSATLFLKWTDASVALVKHVPSDEKQPLANVQELELWRQEIRR